MTATARIEYGADLPVPPDRAFAVVADPTRWPEFSAGTRSAGTDPGWAAVGGRGRMVDRFLGTTVRTEMEVVEWEPGRRLRWRGTQPGRPTTDNLRTFEPMAGGTRLRGSTTIVVRRGPRGVVDRLTLRVLQRIHDRAMVELTHLVRAPTGPMGDHRRPGA